MAEYLFGFISQQRENLNLYLNALKNLLLVQSIKSEIQRKAKLGVSLKGHLYKTMLCFPVRCKLVPEQSEFPAVRAPSSGSVFGWILGKIQAWNDLLHGCVYKSQCTIRDIKRSYLAFGRSVELTLCPTPWNADSLSQALVLLPQHHWCVSPSSG